MRKLIAVVLFLGCASSPRTAEDRPPIPPLQMSEEARATMESQLAAARAQYDANPNDADAIIWLGRRTAYLGRYLEAIDIFTEGIRKHPRDARMYRHRGHRYITIRDFDRAIADLRKATELVAGRPDEVEPDGQPNARNIPIGSLHSNICYHLGLAYYLKGDFERALPVYRRCADDTTNPDRIVSVAHWLYMTLRRLGRPEEAERVLDNVHVGMDVIENISYHKLGLMYRGEIAPEELLAEKLTGTDAPTIRYGIGNWYLYHGQPDRARVLFEQVVAEGPWPAFGVIAAERELEALGPRP